MDGVAAGKVTDSAGEADAADASELRDFVPVKHIDEGGPAQEALAKAAAMTAEARQALEGLDEEASVDEVTRRLEGRLPGGPRPGEGPGGAGRRVRRGHPRGGRLRWLREAVRADREGLCPSRHFWEVLLYGQIGRDRAVMFDLAHSDKLKFTATSEDGRVLDALAHAQRHQAARGEYITAFNEEGKEVDISFATQKWRKAVVDKTRTGQFVRKHFEAYAPKLRAVP